MVAPQLVQNLAASSIAAPQLVQYFAMKSSFRVQVGSFVLVLDLRKSVFRLMF
jgi:hypothetical protein